MATSSSNSFASNAKWLMLVSVFQKIVTFTLNQAMVMSTSPEVLGQAAIQLELLLSTLLFLSREGIRLAAMRQRVTNLVDMQQIVNISWISPFIVLLTSVALILTSGHLFPAYDNTVVYLYCAAAFIECLGEPCYNLFQNSGNIKPRLSAEMSAVTAKSVITVACVAYCGLGVTGFGIAQATYAIVYILVLLSHFCTTNHTLSETRKLSLSDLLPRYTTGSTSELTKQPNETFIAGAFLSTAVTLTGSSLLKHLLTESDKIALTLTASTYNQGIYAVTNNYGSLAARIIFLPLEDSSRLAFVSRVSEAKEAASRLLTVEPVCTIGRSAGKTVDNIKGTQSQQDYASALDALQATVLRLLRLVGFIGLFFAIFGMAYVPVAVKFVLSSQWRSVETTSALRMYCLYLLVMGVNGISEAFVQSAAPPSAFGTLNAGLIVSSVGFVVCAVPAVRYLGTSGIILANVVSMVIRIANNSRYALKMFAHPELFSEGTVTIKEAKVDETSGRSGYGERELSLLGAGAISERTMLSHLRPPVAWIVAAAASVLVTQVSAFVYARSSQSLVFTALHVVVGGVVALVFLSVSYRHAPAEDVSLVTNALNSLRRRIGLAKKND